MSYGGGSGGGKISTASDAALNNPTTGDVLSYNSTLQKWQNVNASDASALTPTAVQTSSYTATANQLIPADATSATLAVTLPVAPLAGTQVIVKKIDTTAHAVTVLASGSDVFDASGGATSKSLVLQNQTLHLVYTASGIWYTVADTTPLTALDTRYAGQSVGNTVYVYNTFADAPALPAGTVVISITGS